MSGELIGKIRNALRDENGLPPPPTDAATDVMIAVLFAMDQTERKWDDRGFPGAPSTTDYAAGVVKFLERRYPVGFGAEL